MIIEKGFIDLMQNFVIKIKKTQNYHVSEILINYLYPYNFTFLKSQVICNFTDRFTFSCSNNFF